jgi:internalin A
MGRLSKSSDAESKISKCRDSGGTSLDLESLGLQSVPEEVRQLRNLKRLDLSNNRIEDLPRWIGELANLDALYLHGNPLRTIPASIQQLSALRILIIARAHASAASESIGNLLGLRELALADLGLRTVPEWVRRLRNIETLYLFGNGLASVPKWLSELSTLTQLSLENNQLRSLPASLKELGSLRFLSLEGNPLLSLPAEIARAGDARKILRYYFRMANGGAAQPLNEFKLILVGRGGVGKTSLVHRLVNDRYKEFRRTPGIKITKWPMRLGRDDVLAHVWDFGGQEIMHGTHRFFMTERALYLVLISGREGTEDYDADYWLSLVRSFAGADVPIIVLHHKTSDWSFELNRELLRKKYGRTLSFLETDSETAVGISELRERIGRLARSLPGLKSSWPMAWRRVKEQLPRKRKSWLTFDGFRTFCTQQNVTERKEQDDLAESLHDLGLMLSYRKDEGLREFGVLNPQWVTNGIYRILNSEKLRKAGGKFTVKAFGGILLK